MTDILCYADSYLKEFDAVVTSVTAKGAILDRTAFYPGGGGQPAIVRPSTNNRKDDRFEKRFTGYPFHLIELRFVDTEFRVGASADAAAPRTLTESARPVRDAP